MQTSFLNISRVIHVFMNIFHCDGLLGPLTSTSLLSFVVFTPIPLPAEPCCSREKLISSKLAGLPLSFKEKKQLELILEYVGKEIIVWKEH